MVAFRGDRCRELLEDVNVMYTPQANIAIDRFSQAELHPADSRFVHADDSSPVQALTADATGLLQAHPGPLWALLWRQIELCYWDAHRTKHGVPTKAAVAAYRWLTSDSMQPFSLGWCCLFLGIPVAQVRERGIAVREYGGMRALRRTGNLRDVVERWRIARALALVAGEVSAHSTAWASLCTY